MTLLKIIKTVIFDQNKLSLRPPLHPGAKLRKGMDAFETFKYSSEFAQPIELKSFYSTIL